MSGKTQVGIDDGIAWITMDDGKVNALSREMIGEIGAALDAAERAGAVTVLRGREGIFSGPASTSPRSGEAPLQA